MPEPQSYTLNYDYSDAPTLQRFSRSRKRVRGVVGPFGSGKSSACVIDIYRKACEQTPDRRGARKTRWAVVRNTYPQLRDTTIKTFNDWFPPQYFGDFRLNPLPDYNFRQQLPDGTFVESEILVRALDKPEHVKNLLSLEVTGAWFNEAREIPKTIIDHMDGRINRYPSKKDVAGGATWAGMIMDTNPCDTDHWWYRLFVEQLPNEPALQELYDYFHQPSGRSPYAENLRHLPRGYYTTMCVAKDPQWVRVYVDGQYGYVKEGKIIYTNYQDLIHCPQEPLRIIKGLHLTLGWDFGLTPACVIMQLDPRGFLNVLHEICATEMGVRSLAVNVVKPFLMANYPGFRLVSGCDPSGVRRSEVDETKSCVIELSKLGFKIKPAWSNSLEARFSAVDNFLTRMIEGKPAFRLDPSCKLLRKGFNGDYKRRRLQIIGAEMYADEPEKNGVSHPHEALQYGVMIIERGMRPEALGYQNSSQGYSQLPPPSAAFC